MRPLSKLSDDQWQRLHERLLAGEGVRALGREFGVSHTAIGKRFGAQGAQGALGEQSAAAHAAARHAVKAREPRASQAPASGAIDDLSIDQARRVRALAEARIKHAEAEMREMDRDEAAGRLIDREVVDFVLADYSATLRGLIESFADRLAPVIYPLQTLDETRAALDEAAEHVLVEMAATMQRRERQHKSKGP